MTNNNFDLSDEPTVPGHEPESIASEISKYLARDSAETKAEVDMIRVELKKLRDRVHVIESRTCENTDGIAEVESRTQTLEHRADETECRLGMFTARLDAIIDDLVKLEHNVDKK